MKNLLIVGLLVFGFAGTAFALPYFQSTQTLVPFVDSAYDVGTSTAAYRNLYVDRICLNTDCQTSWSASAGDITGGSSLGTGLNIFDSESSGVLRFNSLAAGANITLSTTTNSNTIVISATGAGTVSTSTNETAGRVKD